MGIKFPQKAHLPFLASAVHCVWCFCCEGMIVSGEFRSLGLRFLSWKNNEEAHPLLGSLHPKDTQHITKEKRKRGWMWSLETVIRYSILNLFYSTPNAYIYIHTQTHTPRHQRYKLGVITRKIKSYEELGSIVGSSSTSFPVERRWATLTLVPEHSLHPACAVIYFALWTRLHLVIEHRAHI